MNNSEFKQGQEVWAKAIVADPRIDGQGEIHLDTEDGWDFWVKPEEIMTAMPEKPVIPQFVADWIRYCKFTNINLLRAIKVSDVDMYNYTYRKEANQIKRFLEDGENTELFAKAWIYGYIIEQEKLYKIPLKGLVTTDGAQQYLTGMPGKYFASRWNSDLKQIFSQTELDNNVPTCYRQFAKPVEVV